MPKGVAVFYCLFFKVLFLWGRGGTDVAIEMSDTFISQHKKVVSMVLSTSLMVIGLIGGMAFLVYVSLAIMDRLEELKINR